MLASKKGALTKITMCFLWGFVMGKLKGVAKCRGDQGALSQPGGRGEWRVQPPSHPKGQRGVFVVLGEEKWISVGLDHDLFVYIFMSSVIMCMTEGKVSLSKFCISLKHLCCGNMIFLHTFQPGDCEKWVLI